jgi:hypothetical protein
MNATMIKTFVISLIASVILLTIAELAFGWTFDSLEISLIVLIVLCVTYFVTRLFSRPREKDR